MTIDDVFELFAARILICSLRADTELYNSMVRNMDGILTVNDVVNEATIYDDRARRPHQLLSTPVTANVVKAKPAKLAKVCWQWRDTGSCRKEECKFRHYVISENPREGADENRQQGNRGRGRGRGGRGYRGRGRGSTGRGGHQNANARGANVTEVEQADELYFDCPSQAEDFQQGSE